MPCSAIIFLAAGDGCPAAYDAEAEEASSGIVARSEGSSDFTMTLDGVGVEVIFGCSASVSIEHATSPIPAVSPSCSRIFSLPALSAIKGKVALSV